MRSRFVRGIGCVFVAVLALVVTGAIGSAWLLVTVLDLATGTSQPALVPVAAGMFVGALVLLAVVGAVSHGMRGVTNAVADLIDASERVQAGDYANRVPVRSHTPGPVRSLVHSFNTMTERLESDEQQRRTLLADISHELRTPLAVLQGELEAMVDGVYPADDAHLATTLEETRVLARHIDDLRTLALAEAGTLALHREPTDLGVLVEEVAAAFRTSADAVSATIETSVTDDVPLLDVDPVRIREVLGNLVGNALRYAPAGSAVTVAASVTAPGRVAVSVRDAGPGISADLLPHVFERFAKSTESRGSGLGLAIARQLVEAHGGTISAMSRPGEGTSIRFELPSGEPA